MSGPVLARYCCDNERRREIVRAAGTLHGTLNGIDYLEVDPSQLVLTVSFLLPVEGAGAVPAGPPLTKDHLRIAGGTRVTDVAVLSAVSSGNRLTVTVDRVGDFAPYELRLAEPDAEGDVPAGFDTRLAAVTFSFKAACPSGVDCTPDDACPPAAYPEPALDYLAKDYESLRRLMLDRLATTLPTWTERHPADLQVALVELLAYVADHLSYAQDAIATEAHLGTARRRTSVRRHARLLDYPMSDGVSARTYLHFTASTGLTLPGGTAARAGSASSAPVFETLHDLPVRAAHNQISLHTWSDEQCCLPRGATRATLDAPAGTALQAGDLLLLEEIAGPDGSAADPAHRAVVRLVEVVPAVDRLDGTDVLEVAWHDRDALAFPLRISVPGEVTAVARANIALADHGERRPDAALVTEDPEPPGQWRPMVADGPLTRSAGYDEEAPATALLRPDAGQARPVVVLHDDDEEWGAERDLISAGPTDPVFVVELEDDGTSRLRFGDDEYGRRPARGTPFAASYRVGSGTAGNVGPDAVDRLVAAVSGVDAVRNVVPAVGGADPESIDRVRLTAPQAFRVQERAVTQDDYAAIATRVPGVQRAATSLRWTGSWYAAHVTVDRLGGRPLAAGGFARTVTATLDRARMTGVDVQVVPPTSVPVDLALRVCVAAGAIASDVGRAVERRLSARTLPDGRHGLFHPDELTLGQPVYLSRVYAAVLEVAGVSSVTATRLRRLGGPDAGELAAGVLRVSRLEVAELAVDAAHPERGHLELTLVGGL